MKNITTNTMKLKQINVELVKQTLKDEEANTKNGIAKITGLSVATCGNILKELLSSGEVLEIELNASTGGRPARRFVYNENYSHVAVIYARKEGAYKSLSCVISNMKGVQVYDTHIGYAQISIKEIESVIEKLIHIYPTIKALGIGVPGVVNKGIIDICDFKELKHIPIEEHLSKKYNLMVIAENDVNSTSIGFHYKHKKERTGNLAYVYYPVKGNPGAGIIIDGKILKGRTNFAGEVAFLPLGVNVEEQPLIQKEHESFATIVAKTIASINCIINPNCIVLSGYIFTEQLIESIRKLLLDLTPDGHQPELIFEDDIHENYIYGLTSLALDKLSCNIQVIEK